MTRSLSPYSAAETGENCSSFLRMLQEQYIEDIVAYSRQVHGRAGQTFLLLKYRTFARRPTCVTDDAVLSLTASPGQGRREVSDAKGCCLRPPRGVF